MKRILCAVRATVFLVLSAASASAQFETASIVGTVRDNSGAVIGEATVTLTNVATGVSQTKISDASGIFEFSTKGEVPDPARAVPIGKAAVLRPGGDVTVVALSRLVVDTSAAAEVLARAGIEVEVIDPRTLGPGDLAAIVEAVRRTGRRGVAHEAVEHGGFGAEIVAQVQAAAFDYLDAPIVRVGAPFAPIPVSPPLEDAYLPGIAEVVVAVRAVCA